MAAAPTAPGTALRLVYAETEPKSSQSTLWLVNIPDIATRVSLLNMQHREGYPPSGSVSPDGQWIAIFLIPPGTPERSIRTNGGQLWIARSDGSAIAQAADQVGFLGPWSPDSQWISYGRLVPLTQPANSHATYRTEIERISPATQTKSQLLSDEESYGVQPLGWSADSSQFLAARLSVTGEWKVRVINAVDGTLVEDSPLPIIGQLRSITLSADGLHILVESVQAGQDRLNIFDHDSSRPGFQPQPPLSSAPISDQNPVSPVSGVWSPRDSRLWLFQTPRPGTFPQSRVLSVQRGSTNVIHLQPVKSQAPGEILLPASWSPDEQWFVWRQYPHYYSTAFLQANGQDLLIPIPFDKPDNWINLFGWILPAGGGRH